MRDQLAEDDVVIPRPGGSGGGGKRKKKGRTPRPGKKVVVKPPARPRRYSPAGEVLWSSLMDHEEDPGQTGGEARCPLCRVVMVAYQGRAGPRFACRCPGREMD